MQDRTRLVGEQLNWKKVRTAICTKTGSTYTVFPEKKRTFHRPVMFTKIYFIVFANIPRITNQIKI